MDSKEQFLIDYFKKCLKNDTLTDYTLTWIHNNYNKLSSEEPSWYIWQDYLFHFLDKYNLDMWHDKMEYDKIYEIYLDVGFSEEAASSHAKRVRGLMDEPADTMGWGHEPNIFCWLPRLLSGRRIESYNIKDYY